MILDPGKVTHCEQCGKDLDREFWLRDGKILAFGPNRNDGTNKPVFRKRIRGHDRFFCSNLCSLKYEGGTQG